MSNVCVYARFRPLNDRERTGDGGPFAEDSSAAPRFQQHSVRVCKPQAAEDAKQPQFRQFTFDHIFPPSATQADLFDTVGRPICDDFFRGFNCTIMAYGLTGSGKTFTMTGSPDQEGLIPRVVRQLFQTVGRNPPSVVTEIKASYVQIYMEKIQDLLDPHTQNLRLREVSAQNGKKGVVFVEGCKVCTVKSRQDMMRILRRGEHHRTTAETKMNKRSSRSHSVFIITLSQVDTLQETRKTSKLFLVDLAGSEKVKATGASGQVLKQAQAINKSLSTLAMVIAKLSDKTNKPSHVPYRNSKLTRLLTDSLGGNSKTALILACSPAPSAARATYSTLSFGQRAKRIENHAKVNQESSVAHYKKIVAALEEKLRLWEEKANTSASGPTLADASAREEKLQSDLNSALAFVDALGQEKDELSRRLRQEREAWHTQLDELLKIQHEQKAAADFSEEVVQQKIDAQHKRYFEQLERNKTLQTELDAARHQVSALQQAEEQNQKQWAEAQDMITHLEQELEASHRRVAIALPPPAEPNAGVSVERHAGSAHAHDTAELEDAASVSFSIVSEHDEKDQEHDLSSEVSIIQTANLVVYNMDGGMFSFETF